MGTARLGDPFPTQMILWYLSFSGVPLSFPVNLEEEVVPLRVETGWFELLGI